MAKYNPHHQGVRRIHADIRELRKDPSPNYFARPLENNQFEWHFTIRGPPDTPFEGGVYHGRILLPTQYPLKPPNIMFLTPNGRFKVKHKVCLSISAYHPEFWCPAWGIRLMLEALITFLPTPAEGAVGSLTYSDDERRKLAKESLSWRCPECGDPSATLPKPTEIDAAKVAAQSAKYAKDIAQLQVVAPTAATVVRTESEAVGGDDGTAGALPVAAAAPAPASAPASAPAPAPAPASGAAVVAAAAPAPAMTAVVAPSPVRASVAPDAAPSAASGAQPSGTTQPADPAGGGQHGGPRSLPRVLAVDGGAVGGSGLRQRRGSQASDHGAAASGSAEVGAQAESPAVASTPAAAPSAAPAAVADPAAGAGVGTGAGGAGAGARAPRTSPSAADTCLILLAVVLLLLIVAIVSRKIVVTVLAAMY